MYPFGTAQPKIAGNVLGLARPEVVRHLKDPDSTLARVKEQPIVRRKSCTTPAVIPC